MPDQHALLSASGVHKETCRKSNSRSVRAVPSFPRTDRQVNTNSTNVLASALSWAWK